MKKSVTYLSIVLLLIIATNFVTAASFDVGDMLDNAFDPGSVLLLLVFIIVLVGAIWSSSKIFKTIQSDGTKKPIKGLTVPISIAIAFAAMYGVHMLDFDFGINGISANFTLFEGLWGIIIPLILFIGLAFLIWKLKLESILAVGLFFIAMSLTGFAFEKDQTLWWGIILIGLYVVLKVLWWLIFRKKKYDPYHTGGQTPNATPASREARSQSKEYQEETEEAQDEAKAAQKDNKQLQEAQRRINDLENQINKLSKKAQRNPGDQSIRNKLDRLLKGKERIVKYAWKKRKESQKHQKAAQDAQTDAQKHAQKAQGAQVQAHKQAMRAQKAEAETQQTLRQKWEVTNKARAQGILNLKRELQKKTNDLKNEEEDLKKRRSVAARAGWTKSGTKKGSAAYRRWYTKYKDVDRLYEEIANINDRIQHLDKQYRRKLEWIKKKFEQR